MRVQDYYRSPWAPRIHFDEAGAGGGDGGGAGGAGGGAAKPWHDGLDPLLLGHAQNKGWKLDDPRAAFEAAAKSSSELQKHFGVPADQLLKLPKDASDEAGWSAVRQRLGMPKEAKEYDFSTVKFADGTELDQSFTDTMRATLHKVGVAKDMAPDVVKAVVKFMDQADAAEASTRSATLQTERGQLQKDWGTNFEFNKLTAMQGAKRLGVDAQTIAKLESEVGYAKIMEMFRKIGAGTTEDSFIEGSQGGNPTTMNGAAARIEELKSDPDWVARYLKGGAKEKEEMNGLLMLANGIAA